jgi:hypothetical protein
MDNAIAQWLLLMLFPKLLLIADDSKAKVLIIYTNLRSCYVNFLWEQLVYLSAAH